MTPKKKTTYRYTQNNKKNSHNQVRIIGGRFKRQLISFIDADGLRPTPDRLRETLFNWIQFDLYDALILDPCAGSGVLGFEALSRGARHTTFIEKQPKQSTLLCQNAKKLHLTAKDVSIYTGDALQVLTTIEPFTLNNNHKNNNDTSTTTLTFDLVFLDPPYDLELWQPLIQVLCSKKLVSKQTLFYIEDKRPIEQTLHNLPATYTVLKQTKVGQIYASLISIEANI